MTNYLVTYHDSDGGVTMKELRSQHAVLSLLDALKRRVTENSMEYFELSVEGLTDAEYQEMIKK